MRRPVSDSSYPVSTSDSDRAEELSVAYVSVIAARAGIRVENVARKDDGTDMTFKRLRKRKSDNSQSDMSGIIVPCQIKSVRSPEWKFITVNNKDVVTYRLRRKNYNDLVTSTYGFLILMCLPSSVDLAVKQDEESLCLHKCCYYWEPGLDDQETDNDSTKTIHIPREQVFTAEVLADIVDGAQPGIEL